MTCVMWGKEYLWNVIVLQTGHLSNLVYLYAMQVTLLQISVPSRTDVKEYQDLKEEMDQLVGHINGRFTTYNWSPIRYIYGCVSQDELAGFYRDAAVALVTPLRDGMAALFL
jgi:trehalose-6-phosphate synthase